jgi:stringent starvation protein B
MAPTMTSTKPYIVRAFYEWISDNELTPYITVDINVYGVMVPMAYANDGQIVLNISLSAVGTISMIGDSIEFSARFGGKLEHISVPYGAIAAIYAKENGAGTSLEIEHPPEEPVEKLTKSALTSVPSDDADQAKPEKKGKPSLKLV